MDELRSFREKKRPRCPFCNWFLADMCEEISRIKADFAHDVDGSPRLQTVVSLRKLRQGSDVHCQDCRLIFRDHYYERDHNEDRKYAIVQMQLANNSEVQVVETPPCFEISKKLLLHSPLDSTSRYSPSPEDFPIRARPDLASNEYTERISHVLHDGTIQDHLIPDDDDIPYSKPISSEQRESCTTLETTTGNKFTVVPFGHSRDLGNYTIFEVFRAHNDTVLESVKRAITPNLLRANRWRLPTEDSSSDQANLIVARWMKNCLQHHELCRSPFESDHLSRLMRGIRPVAHAVHTCSTNLPKRVLEIKGHHVFLRETPSIRAAYACLSHCWGVDGAALQLTSATLGRFKGGIATRDLPKTFKDAASICNKHGLRYIWIDALCIMQDNEDDWKEAAATMASIYASSFITIAATWSDDSHGGCYYQTQNKDRLQRLGQSSFYARVRLPSFPFDVVQSKDDWPLLTRGWVYQERRLSPRIVHYAKNCLYWECKSIFLSEHGREDRDLIAESDYNLELDSLDPDSYQLMMLPLKYQDRRPSIAWRNIVTDYSGLCLTKVKDLLPALAGIVEQEMRERRSDTYIAGMWASNLLTELTFYSREGPRTGSDVPTWSWAHFRGYTKWYNVVPLPAAKLVNVSFKPKGPANLGQVTNASITLRGPMMSVALESEHCYYPAPHVVPIGASLSYEDIVVELPRTLEENELGEPETPFAVMILSFTNSWYMGNPGILLKQHTSGKYARMTAVLVKPSACRPSRGLEHDHPSHSELTERMNGYIATLPISEVEII